MELENEKNENLELQQDFDAFESRLKQLQETQIEATMKLKEITGKCELNETQAKSSIGYLAEIEKLIEEARQEAEVAKIINSV
jgi:hypothetical protein